MDDALIQKTSELFRKILNLNIGIRSCQEMLCAIEKNGVSSLSIILRDESRVSLGECNLSVAQKEGIERLLDSALKSRAETIQKELESIHRALEEAGISCE